MKPLMRWAPLAAGLALSAPAFAQTGGGPGDSGTGAPPVIPASSAASQSNGIGSFSSTMANPSVLPAPFAPAVQPPLAYPPLLAPNGALSPLSPSTPLTPGSRASPLEPGSPASPLAPANPALESSPAPESCPAGTAFDGRACVPRP